MLARTIGVLGFFGGLLLGCGNSRLPPEKRVAAYGACHNDGDCVSAFCDRTVCVPLDRRGHLGGECDPLPPPWLPDAGSLDRGCGEFVCIERRCRACYTDKECATYGGGGKCDPFNMHKCTGGPARDPKDRLGPGDGVEQKLWPIDDL